MLLEKDKEQIQPSTCKNPNSTLTRPSGYGYLVLLGANDFHPFRTGVWFVVLLN